MKNKKNVLLLIVVFCLVATILYFSVNLVAPFGCVPIDDLDMGDTYLEVIYKKGFPDAITYNDITGTTYLLYENQTVLGQNMTVEYGFLRNCLAELTYHTECSDNEVFNETKEYILKNMDCEYRLDEQCCDENRCRIVVGQTIFEEVDIYRAEGLLYIQFNFWF